MKVDREFALRLLASAQKKGADMAEVYLKTARNLSVEVMAQEMDALESSIDVGYALRVIKDKRLGFSYSADINNPEAVVENAIEASRWTEQDDCLDLPSPTERQQVKIFDKAIVSLSEQEAMNRALLIEKTALDFDKRIRKIRKASASFSQKEVFIVNSRGVDETCSATACSAQIMVVAEEKSESQMGWDFDGSRALEEVSFEEVGRNAAKRALQLLGSRKISTLKTSVILDNSVAVEFLGLFASLLSSEAVQKGKSLLAGKVGQQVISPVLNIIDDGCLDYKLGSRPFDDEGVAVSKKYLIRDGILSGYMYNSYTAKKAGLRSSGNAVRPAFSALPSTGPLNLCIDASTGCITKDLATVMDKGLYITEAMGVHTANPVSGEFSIGITGLWVENGLVKYPVKEAVISGNILDFFSRVEAAGADLRFYGNMASPSLLVGQVDISA